ncbi:hypothetical protein Tco_0087175 [Tanacetum coccineum]
MVNTINLLRNYKANNLPQSEVPLWRYPVDYELPCYLRLTISPNVGFLKFLRLVSHAGFPAQSVRSSNAIALDSPYLLVLITGTSQSRQHVDTSLIHIESRKPPTAELFDVDSGRISIITMNTREYHSKCSGNYRKDNA